MTPQTLGDDRDAIRAEQDRPRAISEASRRLLSGAIVIDMTVPVAEGNLLEHRVLERARNVGFSFVSLSVDEESARDTLKCIATVQDYVARLDDDFLYIRNARDIRHAFDLGLTGVGIHFQNSEPVENDLELLPIYRELGVTHMLLAYNVRNRAADGCAEPSDGGLSLFGKRLVRAMREAGIILDGSHTGYRSTMEAIELFEGTVIFSHSNCKAIFDHYRNVTDDQIRACAATGGVVGINGVGRLLGDPYARAETMFRHIDHVVSLVGPEHVGIGLDRMADPERMWAWLHQQSAMWPANAGTSIQYATYAPPEAIGEVVDLMLSHGYGDEAVAGYLGLNFQRVLESAEGK